MKLTSYAMQITGKSFADLFDPKNPLVRIFQDSKGSSFSYWDAALGVTKPTAAQIATALVADEPVPTSVDLMSYAALVRYNKEISGMTINGTFVATDRSSQNLVSGAVTLLNSDPSLAQINFKSGIGVWATIPRANMVVIGVCLGNYVQACFNAEKDLDDKIASGTVTTLAQIDAYSWPSTTITTGS